MATPILLTLNPGSSTIKLGLYALDEGGPRRLGRGIIDLQHDPLSLRIDVDGQRAEITLTARPSPDLHEVMEETLEWLAHHLPGHPITAFGHRVVHGGARFAGPERITDETLEAIAALTPLAPLHQPQSLRLIRAIRHFWPEHPQTASFDTAFHRSQDERVRRFALPRALFDEGIQHYGFHGLSYRFIAGELARTAPELARGRVVVAHLGSGASLCGLESGASRDTTMGFSTLDGIPMSTRCGALDPGVLLHLLQQRGLDAQAVSDMLYHRSGLLGISGISADARMLAESGAPEARQALEIFAFRIAQSVAALATTLGGLDGVVFTAGIGEHQPAVRAAVCAHLAWLGAALDPEANAANATRIEAASSRIAVRVIPTDEEQVIAEEAATLLRGILPNAV
ncbi:acetate/propionate family kinase [Kaistia nematophila]|uniref:Acetate kinase n=1 Tax=Kaistia nematophila TaxID=2994654 RepID=A0A9X3EC59_9HYPH|nr:acetate/propionate family kinase [Kaistia nematophila]MCX5570175.1 acetate/propionate family kinase [Kaistia nematophila]